jgi:hypothetical protein
MATSDGVLSRLAYLVEGTPNTIPTTPTWKILRYENESINVDKQVDMPQEIVPHASTTDVVDVGRSVGGGVNGFLSYATWDDFLASLFRSTWSTNVLKNGVTPSTLAFEKRFDHGGGSYSFTRYTGCRVTSMALQLTAQKSIGVSFNVLGIQDGASGTGIISGATYTAANSNPILNAALNVGNLSFTGFTGGAVIQSMNLNVANGAYANYSVGAYAPDSIGLGIMKVSGSITAYFKSLDLYEAILGHDDLAFSADLGAASGASYTLTIPKFKGVNGGPITRGATQAVMVEMPFEAKYDSASSCIIQIERGV